MAYLIDPMLKRAGALEMRDWVIWGLVACFVIFLYNIQKEHIQAFQTLKTEMVQYFTHNDEKLEQITKTTDHVEEEIGQLHTHINHLPVRVVQPRPVVHPKPLAPQFYRHRRYVAPRPRPEQRYYQARPLPPPVMHRRWYPIPLFGGDDDD